MPAYDYRCTVCGRVIELVHRMSETITERDHTDPESDSPCTGTLERLISAVGVNQSVGTKPPSDSQLKNAGFTKYVKGKSGYEKAFGGPDTPNTIKRGS
jgi:putative FmdB family regulatory protein